MLSVPCACPPACMRTQGSLFCAGGISPRNPRSSGGVVGVSRGRASLPALGGPCRCPFEGRPRRGSPEFANLLENLGTENRRAQATNLFPLRCLFIPELSTG